MSRLLPLLLLAFASCAALAAPAEVFTATVRGSLTVGPDGRVVDVALVDAAELGESTIAGVEQLVRSWQFEPIVENGAPVSARGSMILSLIAETDAATGDTTLGLRNAWFIDPQELGSRRAPPTMPRPRYPMRALQQGAGAELMLLLELADDGSVVRVETEQVALLGAPVGPDSDRHVRDFVRVTEDAAAEWRLPESAGRTVRIPVRFSSWRGGWEPLRTYTWTPDPWVLVKLAERVAVESLNGSGEASRLRLAEPDATASPDGG